MRTYVSGWGRAHAKCYFASLISFQSTAKCLFKQRFIGFLHCEARTMACFERILGSIVNDGTSDDSIARITSFNMHNVIVTRETLFRLSGYGVTACDRYLDDQVS